MYSRIAAYSGSFRPLHYGHLDIIRRTAPLFDELIVLVVANNGKEQVFTLEERADLIRAEASDVRNMRVLTSAGRYAARVAHELGARMIVRGVRNAADVASELALADANRSIAPDMETVLIPAHPTLRHISSTLVWQHVDADPTWETEVTKLVPLASLELLRRFWRTKTAT